MNALKNLLPVAFLTLLFLTVCAGAASPPRSEWVYPSPDDGRLLYKEDDRGNRIPDFSFVGYRNGSVRER